MKIKNFLCSLIILYFICLSFELLSQTYVGSNACQGCHNTHFNDWKKSGHPYKIQRIENGVPPSYPAGLISTRNIGSTTYTLQPGVPRPPKGYTWQTIGWVLGGYHSNARFLNSQGYLILGDSTQYNIATNQWVMYTQSAPGTTMYMFSCYRCHTTGPSPNKTPAFQQFPGIEGSWVEAGVGCEACHGPGSQHVSNPIGVKPPKDGYATCNNCHARDRGTTFAWNYRVEWMPTTVSGVPTGFIRHREQGDMMYASKHHTANMTCKSCHAPHKSVYYNLGGIKPTATCESCHPNKIIQGHGPNISKCTDCHMPSAARSAVAFNPYLSEQSAHFWKIITAPITMRDNLDTTVAAGRFFIKVDAQGYSGLTLDYTCLQCHTTRTVQWAAQYAANIHQTGVNVEKDNDIPTAYTLGQNYPNPFNPFTRIDFTIAESGNVNLSVYTISGELIKTLIDEHKQAGRYTIEFNAGNLPSGVYVYRITSNNFSYSRKMVLMK